MHWILRYDIYRIFTCIRNVTIDSRDLRQEQTRDLLFCLLSCYICPDAFIRNQYDEPTTGVLSESVSFSIICRLGVALDQASCLDKPSEHLW